MDWVGHPLFRKFILFLVLLLAFNAVILDILFVREIITQKNLPPTTPPSSSATLPAPSPDELRLCPVSCLDAIQTATLSAKPTVITPISTSQINKVTDNYVPLGASSFYSVGDWADVPGLEVTVDPANFGTIKQVTFEASLHVPNGNEDVWVRLYNATDQHAVWYSDLFFPSNTTTNFLSSPTITLDTGAKVYKVQMKTQFTLPASLDQSRIHIVTK